MQEQKEQKQFFVLQNKLNQAQRYAINGLSKSCIKKCEWCNSLIYNYTITEKRAIKKDNKDKTFGYTRFCCIDCKNEYDDWKYIISLNKHKERIKRQNAKQKLKYHLKKSFPDRYKKKTCNLV